MKKEKLDMEINIFKLFTIYTATSEVKNRIPEELSKSQIILHADL